MTASQITRLINGVAMLIALFLFALVLYHIYQRHFVPQRQNLAYQFDDLPALNAAPVKVNVNKIIKGHLFGQVPVIPKAAPVVVKQPIKTKPKLAPKSALNVKLSGIILGASPESGMAMMQIDRGRTLIVAVGEKIKGTDAILHQVLPGEVLVDRDGAIESIKMERKTLSLAKLDDSLLANLPQPSANTSTRYDNGVQTGLSNDNPNFGLEEGERRARIAKMSKQERRRNIRLKREQARGQSRGQARDSLRMGALPVPDALKQF